MTFLQKQVKLVVKNQNKTHQTKPRNKKPHTKEKTKQNKNTNQNQLKRTSKRVTFMENIISLYNNNIQYNYLNYLKPLELSFLGSEYLKATFLKVKSPSWKHTEVRRRSAYDRTAFQIVVRLLLYSTQVFLLL